MVVGGVDVGVSVKQVVDDVVDGEACSEDEGRRAVLLARVHVDRTVLQQVLHSDMHTQCHAAQSTGLNAWPKLDISRSG